MTVLKFLSRAAWTFGVPPDLAPGHRVIGIINHVPVHGRACPVHKHEIGVPGYGLNRNKLAGIVGKHAMSRCSDRATRMGING